MDGNHASDDTEKAEFWKQWWDDCAKRSTSDYILNRGTDIRLTELERRGELQLLDAVRPCASDVVLDAGCGSGRNLSILSGRVRSVAGVDFSAHMLARARTRIREERLPNVTLGKATVTALPFANDSFDKVLCLSVLQYLDDRDCRAAFAELSRVCKHGGVIVVHIKNGSSLYGLSKRCAHHMLTLLGRRSLPEHYRRRPVHERIIKECGCRIVGMDSFGVFTFVGLPRQFVPALLRLETVLPRWPSLKRLGVNCQVTILVTK